MTAPAPDPDRPLYGGIEAGGTKFVCAIGHEPNQPLQVATFPTRDPERTLADVVGFFQGRVAAKGKLTGLGVASFGPLALEPNSQQFGRIGSTPKPGWSHFDLRGHLARSLSCPILLDTDVNGAGRAEAVFGAGQGRRLFAYLTIGTGIGGGLIQDGRPVFGLTHAEMGHILVRRHPLDQDFPGLCPFHQDCLEGLASGAAIMARQGHSLSGQPEDHPLWQIVTDYIAQLCGTLMLIAAPERIILGGGVMANGKLLPLVRAEMTRRLNGYIDHPALARQSEDLIVPPGLGDRAGVIGALLLAEEAALPQ
jgi:fructokinase